MIEKIEGTMVLDGLLQGRLPNCQGPASLLRDWCAAAQKKNLLFNLEVEGGNFSLLPDNHPVLAGPLGPEPSDQIAGILDALLQKFSPPQRTGVTCTVRSVEYRPGQEVQTIYVITPAGHVAPQRRFVDAQTKPPPQPLSTRQKLKVAGAGLVLVVALLGVTSLFVDYRALASRLIKGVIPLDAAKVQVDTGAFSPYLVVEGKEKADGGRTLRLDLRRTDAFPRTTADMQRLMGQATSLPGNLAAEDLARGYIRIEYFDDEGRCFNAVQVRLSELRDKERVSIKIPIEDEHKPARLAFVE